jgi:hypothetical protein
VWEGNPPLEKSLAYNGLAKDEHGTKQFFQKTGLKALILLVARGALPPFPTRRKSAIFPPIVRLAPISR